jgi:hypothetical protein
MGTLRKLSARYGDLAVDWDVTDKASVDKAMETFEAEMASGQVAVALTDEHPDGVVVKKFDPAASEILTFPQIQGG